MSSIFNDEYTYDIDALGYREQADKIRDMIIDCETPFVIGISGRWGSGKTSLMKYLMASLGGKVHGASYEKLEDEKSDEIYNKVQNEYSDADEIKHIHSVWFNPWEHENHGEPIIELLKEIRTYFSFVSKLWEKTKKLGAVTIRSGIDMLDGIFSVFTKFAHLPSPSLSKNIASTIQAHGEKQEYEDFEYDSRNQKFKLIFQKAVEKLLTRDDDPETDTKAKLVIFIDDLDRCEETTISKLLSEIKQHLSTKKCVFVFGYDRHHVEKALAKTIQRSNKETRSYLEKLFQSTIYIKQPTEKIYKKFVKERLRDFSFVPDNKCEDLSGFVCDIIDPNPRRIKAFLTAFRFHSQKFSSDKPEEVLLDLQRLALITYLKIFHEPVYSVLENNNKLLEDLIAVFKHNDRDAIANHNQYFFYLEMRSHLQDYTEKVFTEKITEREFLKNDESAEKKFLTEVYEMQGRHKSYENFRQKFQDSFNPAIESSEYEDIKKYL